jgi:hypothetical protein
MQDWKPPVASVDDIRARANVLINNSREETICLFLCMQRHWYLCGIVAKNAEKGNAKCHPLMVLAHPIKPWGGTVLLSKLPWPCNHDRHLSWPPL